MGFPGKDPGVGCHFLLQGIFPTQEARTCVSCVFCICRWILYHWAIWETLANKRMETFYQKNALNHNYNFLEDVNLLYIFIILYWSTACHDSSSEQQRVSAIHIQVSILPHTSPPSRLPCNWAEFHALDSRALLVIHDISVCPCPSQTPQLSLPPSFPPATISSFSKSVSLFLFCKFICIISF